MAALTFIIISSEVMSHDVIRWEVELEEYSVVEWEEGSAEEWGVVS